MNTPLLRPWRHLMFRWRRDRLASELAEELDFHRSLKQSEFTGAGLTTETIDALTSRHMGNVTLAQEESRDMWSFLSIERLLQDVLFALRVFAKNPTFVAVAALSLALGIGGNAAMFSLVNSLLFRPLPYPDAQRLLRITGVYPKAGVALFQEQSRSMDLASVSPGSEFNLTGVGTPLRVTASSVSANLFSVLQAPIQIGRGFQPGEDRPGQDGVVIISHTFWKTEFGGDPQVVGRMLALNNVSRKIVGIMPADFNFPSRRVQLWIPARLDPPNFEAYWGTEYVPLIARLRPGATLPQAQGEVQAMMNRLRALFPFPMPHNWNGDATAIPLQADMIGNIRGKLLVLLISVGAVLLIACANVASLLLSRATARRKEIALRVALGAGCSRIVRQLLTESILLACIGAALGFLLGTAALSTFKSVLPRDLPGVAAIAIDWQVACFVAGLALLTGLAFGIAPALSASQIDLAGAMKTGSLRSTTVAWASLRSWLIAGEIALTVVLVVSAGLLLKSLYRMSEVNPGFNPQRILTVRISPNPLLCAQRASCIALYDRLLTQARAVSGVSAVALANTVPLDGQLPDLPADVEDHPKTADFPAPMFWTGAVSPDYFQLMHIPLIAGRAFTSTDAATSPSVVVINAATARRFWPGQNAVGKHIKTVFDDRWRTIVGVVGDVYQFNLAGRSPEGISGAMYMPYAQAVTSDQQIPAAMNLLVLISANTTRIGDEIRQLVRDQNPDVPVSEMRALHGIVDDSVADFRSTIWVFLSFAFSAILLAAVGIYGLMSNSVAQRTYEIGVRVAIGATKTRILTMVLAQGLRIALLGIGSGLLVSFILTRYLASLLFGVAATDPVTFAAVCALVLAISAMASCVPAWRAANLDPVKSLRAD